MSLFEAVAVYSDVACNACAGWVFWRHGPLEQNTYITVTVGTVTQHKRLFRTACNMSREVVVTGAVAGVSQQNREDIFFFD